MPSGPTSESMDPPRAALEIRTINVFDFDNTCFASPLPNPNIWHSSILKLLTGSFAPGIGWWTDPRSLDLGPEEEASGWAGRWNEAVCEDIRASSRDTSSLTVLLTGRSFRKFILLLRRMCASQHLPFDILGLKPSNDLFGGVSSWSLPFESSALRKGIVPSSGQLTYIHPPSKTSQSRWMSTLDFKRTFLLSLLQHFPKATTLRIYEDRVHHAREFDLMGEEWRREGLISTFQTKVIEPLTRPMDEQREKDFVIGMIDESNAGVNSGRMILHVDADSALTLERAPPPPTIPFTYSDPGGFAVTPSVPPQPNSPTDRWFMVTYARADAERPGWFRERTVVSSGRTWRSWDIVQIPTDTGRALIGVKPEPAGRGEF
ncbi:hypothetical protein M427DRAFT_146682 [Gonapodya prolifera JEL478]|uniref:Swiss Army Knife RNA repair protein HAD domain-containing protein n=1 Tax=Gonapodya prolifera (strain JEL478) TaxID=1344416 RepID=A0A139A8W7_GONPJ|nr:hypothetical protein M427DRAFT_146682 [Gonapodya prolifera JEL478]|eukprot:KXS13271.1 hypothetical protein M427DRAFT_146682 [Gonapodya prolifera JEL478]